VKFMHNKRSGAAGRLHDVDASFYCCPRCVWGENVSAKGVGVLCLMHE